jgi:hypothetical protein
MPARQFLDRETQADLGARIPFIVYFQDPFVTSSNKAYDVDVEFTVPSEPGLADGPTSACFAIVDYDGTTEGPKRTQPAGTTNSSNSSTVTARLSIATISDRRKD